MGEFVSVTVGIFYYHAKAQCSEYLPCWVIRIPGNLFSMQNMIYLRLHITHRKSLFYNEIEKTKPDGQFKVPISARKLWTR